MGESLNRKSIPFGLDIGLDICPADAEIHLLYLCRALRDFSRPGSAPDYGHLQEIQAAVFASIDAGAGLAEWLSPVKGPLAVPWVLDLKAEVIRAWRHVMIDGHAIGNVNHESLQACVDRLIERWQILSVATTARLNQAAKAAYECSQVAGLLETSGAESGKSEKPTAESEDNFASDPRTARKVQGKTKLATAMMLVQEHPDWSDRYIAEQARYKSHSTLVRNKTYQAAATMARGKKEDLLHGTKNRETGDVEAWDDADEAEGDEED